MAAWAEAWCLLMHVEASLGSGLVRVGSIRLSCVPKADIQVGH